jgi:hypothetical protein
MSSTHLVNSTFVSDWYASLPFLFLYRGLIIIDRKLYRVPLNGTDGADSEAQHRVGIMRIQVFHLKTF